MARTDHSMFPSQGELNERADALLRERLDPLPRPLTWAAVSAALNGMGWIAHAAFDDPWTHSNEYGDYIIHIRDSLVGYRTYRNGAVPGEYYIGPGISEKGGVC